jgi:hypothetical protein
VAEALDWTRVAQVPASDVFALRHYGTTLYAGTSNTAYVGAVNGTSWTETTPIDASSAAIETVVPAGGALWAGTFNLGAFRSTDAGASWQPVNAGLAGLGSEDVVQFVEKDGRLYAATRGAGVFVRDLAEPSQWSEFNAGLPVLTAGSVQALLLHGTTLVAPAGPNGYVYRFPQGATEWQEVAIVPPIAPGLLASDLIDVGGDLLVGANSRAYRSEDDAQSWTFAGSGLAHGSVIFLAAAGAVAYAGVDSLGSNYRLYRSVDRGRSWQLIDNVLGSFLYALQFAGGRLYAARSDGLWWTPVTATGTSTMSWGALKATGKN